MSAATPLILDDRLSAGINLKMDLRGASKNAIPNGKYRGMQLEIMPSATFAINDDHTVGLALGYKLNPARSLVGTGSTASGVLVLQGLGSASPRIAGGDFPNKLGELDYNAGFFAAAVDYNYKGDASDWLVELTFDKGRIVSAAKDPEAESVYEMYYEFDEALNKVPGHRILAINRGEKEKVLTVKVEAPEEEIISYLESKVILKDNPNTTEILKDVIADSYKRLIAPAIEREIRSSLTEKAEDSAIKVFGKNLVQLLMQPPIIGKVVLGWDPAFRTGLMPQARC